VSSRRAAAVVAGGILALGLAIACGRPPPRVLLIGDSITAGSVSEPKGPAYPERLAAEFGEALEIVVAACDATTTRDWLPEGGSRACGQQVVRPDLYTGLVIPALPVDVAVLLLGSNDAHGYREREPISVEEYGTNLRAIADALLSGGAERVVLMSAPPTYHRVKRYRRLMSLRAQVSQICGDVERIDCGPNLFDLLAPEDFAPENLHPNGEGHVKIAQALAETLQPLASR
jgi:lysophospholipase L1-like esterase